MATLPADRTKLAQAQSNMAPSFTASSQKLKDALTEAYDTIDTLNQKVDTHGGAATLPHADKSVIRVKLADKVVGAGQLDDAAVGQIHHQDNGIPSRALPDNVILQRHMSDNSVGSAEIIAGAVQRTHLANGVVAAGQLDPTLLQNYGDIAVQAEFEKRGVNVAKFGAKGDYNGTTGTDDSAAIQAAFDYVYANRSAQIFFTPNASYLVTKPIVIRGSNITIDLNYATITNKSLATVNFTVPFNIEGDTLTDNYNVPAVFLLRHEDNAYQERIRIKNGFLSGDTASPSAVVGIFAPRVRYLEIEDVQVSNCKYGYHTYITYLSTFKKFFAYRYGEKGIYFQKNTQISTTCSFIDCYVGGGGVGKIGWHIEGLIYSSMHNCSSETCTEKAFYFTDSNLNLTTCGSETCTGSLLHIVNSYVEISNFSIRRYTRAGAINTYSFDNSRVNVSTTKLIGDMTDLQGVIELKNATTATFTNCLKPDRNVTISKDTTSGFTVVQDGYFQSSQAERSRATTGASPIWTTSLAANTMNNSTLNNGKGAYGTLWYLTGNYQSTAGEQFTSYLLAIYKTLGGKYKMNTIEIGATAASSTTGALKSPPTIDITTGVLTISGYDFCQYTLSRVDNLGGYPINNNLWEWT